MMRQRGFSLIELIMVIIIVSAISGVAGLLLSAGFKSYTTAKPIMSSASRANSAMIAILREIKNAQSVTAIGANTLTFVNAQGQSIQIGLGSGGSGAGAFDNLTTTTLARSLAAAQAQPLVTTLKSPGTSNVLFTYYDANLASTAVLANINYVALNLTLAEDQASYTLMSGTLIRTNL